MPLGVQPSMRELADITRALVHGMAVGADGVPVELAFQDNLKR